MEIHLTSPKHGTHIVYFDIEDWDKIKDYRWHVVKGGNTLYAQSSNKRTTKKMHRLIMNTPKDMHTDHVNGDGLDNRKSNLRICTRSENMMNRSMHINNTSEYKGVCWRKDHKKFIARIRFNKKLVNLGYFKTAIEAAKKYNEAAIKYHGEFARLNIIQEAL